MDTEKKGSQMLCCHHEIPELMKAAEAEKEKLMREFKQFYTGDIDIQFHENRHIMGCSLAADLLINGELVKEYDPADLCFLDLNELMLKRMMEARKQEQTPKVEPKIQFIHEGQHYAMIEAEIEAAYRYRLHSYLLEDARNHLDDEVSANCSKFYEGDQFQEEYGITVEEAYSDEMMERYVAWYERCHDCDIDENSLWDAAIRGVLTDMDERR